MPTASLANPSRAKKIHKTLNKPEKCPLNHLGKMTSQALPDRLEMLPAADDKSVWDMAPAGLSSGGFFIGVWDGGIPGHGSGPITKGPDDSRISFGDLANRHRQARVEML